MGSRLRGNDERDSAAPTAVILAFVRVTAVGARYAYLTTDN